MSGTYRSEGVVLQKRPLGEADLIVTLLLPEGGRTDAVAKGARRSSRSRMGMCEPFQHLDLLLARGRSLDVISQMQVRRAYTGIARDLERLAIGTYLLELYLRLLEPGPHASSGRVFASLLRALAELEESGGVPELGRQPERSGGGTSREAGDQTRVRSALPVLPELICRRAELRLLTVLGVAPHLDSCIQCEGSQELTHFDVERGAVVCAGCHERGGQARPVPPAILALLRTLRTPRLETLSSVSDLVSPADLRACEQLLRSHMEWHWPARLRSRSFLEQVRQA